MSESSKAPKCKLCGKAHWSNEPHDFSVAGPPDKKVAARKKAKVVRRAQKKSSAARPAVQAVEKVELPAAVSKIDSGLSDAARRKAEWRRKNPEKYREYQRKYMAERRAKAKKK